MLSQEIQEMIKEEARIYCSHEAMVQSREDVSYCQMDYKQGATKWAERMEEFEEWKRNNYFFDTEERKYRPGALGNSANILLTFSEVLTLFINMLTIKNISHE